MHSLEIGTRTKRKGQTKRPAPNPQMSLNLEVEDHTQVANDVA